MLSASSSSPNANPFLLLKIAIQFNCLRFETFSSCLTFHSFRRRREEKKFNFLFFRIIKSDNEGRVSQEEIDQVAPPFFVWWLNITIHRILPYFFSSQFSPTIFYLHPFTSLPLLRHLRGAFLSWLGTAPCISCISFKRHNELRRIAGNSLRIIFIDTLLRAGEGHKVYYWISVSWMGQAKVNKFPECEKFYNVKWVFSPLLQHQHQRTELSPSLSRENSALLLLQWSVAKEGRRMMATKPQFCLFNYLSLVEETIWGTKNVGFFNWETVGRTWTVVVSLLRWAGALFIEQQTITSDPVATTSLVGVNYAFEEVIQVNATSVK